MTRRAVQGAGLLAGALGAAGAIALALLDGTSFTHGWLAAWGLWIGVPIGCSTLLMMHHLTGGRWGWSIRPGVEAATATIPLLALGFVPVLLGLSVYHWTEPGVADEGPKGVWLGAGFFVGRALGVLACWVGVSLVLVRWSRAGGRPLKLRRLSAAGLPLWVLTVSVAAVDWFGSLDPHWTSSIWGLYVHVGDVLTGLAVAILARLAVERESPDPDALNDLGNLLLAFVVLHAYMAYSQLFITWNGNKPHEVAFYAERWHGAWAWVALALLLCHFALPFLALLLRSVKRRTASLAAVAALVLLARVLDTGWQVLPSGPAAGATTLLAALASVVAIGGVWLALFARLSRAPAVVRR